MIMSVLGHTTLAEAERYTEEADQASLAVDILARLEGHKANAFSQCTPLPATPAQVPAACEQRISTYWCALSRALGSMALGPVRRLWVASMEFGD